MEFVVVPAPYGACVWLSPGWYFLLALRVFSVQVMSSLVALGLHS